MKTILSRFHPKVKYVFQDRFIGVFFDLYAISTRINYKTSTNVAAYTFKLVCWVLQSTWYFNCAPYCSLCRMATHKRHILHTSSRFRCPLDCLVHLLSTKLVGLGVPFCPSIASFLWTLTAFILLPRGFHAQPCGCFIPVRRELQPFFQTYKNLKDYSFWLSVRFLLRQGTNLTGFPAKWTSLSTDFNFGGTRRIFVMHIIQIITDLKNVNPNFQQFSEGCVWTTHSRILRPHNPAWRSRFR